MSRKVYVVCKYKDLYDYGYALVEINGPINHTSVKKALWDTISDELKQKFSFILSWQIEEV